MVEHQAYLHSSNSDPKIIARMAHTPRVTFPPGSTRAWLLHSVGVTQSQRLTVTWFSPTLPPLSITLIGILYIPNGVSPFGERYTELSVKKKKKKTKPDLMLTIPETLLSQKRPQSRTSLLLHCYQFHIT